MPEKPEQNKLAILYVLKESQMRLSESQFARIMSELSVMNFFDLKTALLELTEGGQIAETPTLQGPTYALTAAGGEMIRSLRTDLLHSTRRAIGALLAEQRENLQTEAGLPAAYSQVGDGKYRVQAQILSDDIPIFQLTMILETREEANLFVTGWKEKGPAIYQRILLDLTV